MTDEREEGVFREQIMISHRVNRISPEYKGRVRILLILLLAVLVAATSVFNIITHVLFNPAEIAVDFSIYVFVAALIMINYSPTRATRSLRFKRMTYGVLLFLALFALPFALLYGLFLAGYTYVFDFQYFAVIFTAVMIVNFFITTSWKWNRKFSDFSSLGKVRFRLSDEGITRIDRGTLLSDNEEELVNDYIRGKVSTNDVLEILGDTPDTRKILEYADSAIGRMRKNYRW